MHVQAATSGICGFSKSAFFLQKKKERRNEPNGKKTECNVYIINKKCHRKTINDESSAPLTICTHTFFGRHTKNLYLLFVFLA